MRLMTYNIRGTKGMDGTRSVTRIAQTVEEYAPDIVCFQEIHQRFPGGDLTDEPHRLTELLGGVFVFQRNIELGFGGYGIGIWTHHAVRQVEKRFLPSVGERRGMLYAELEREGQAFGVACTHWGLKSAERLSQAGAMSAYLTEKRLPLLIAGDLNDVTESPCVRALMDALELTDADVQGNRLTYPADLPTHRIDFAFASPQFTVKHVEVGTSQASDHLPLVVDLNLPFVS